eukprot:sb/3476444/
MLGGGSTLKISIDTHFFGKWKFYFGNFWKFLEIFGNLWKFMAIYGKWKFLEVFVFETPNEAMAWTDHVMRISSEARRMAAWALRAFKDRSVTTMLTLYKSLMFVCFQVFVKFSLLGQ